LFASLFVSYHLQLFVALPRTSQSFFRLAETKLAARGLIGAAFAGLLSLG
jgi:hypothetical protein